MKKIFALFIVFVMLVTNVYAVPPLPDIRVTIGGEEVIFPDQKPLIKDGRTLVPVRGIFEHLGFAVDWIATQEAIYLNRADYDVKIILGQNNFTANDEIYSLEVPAQIINGRTMLPIRAVLESVGYDINWDATARVISIDFSAVGETVARINGQPIGANDVRVRIWEAEFFVDDFDSTLSSEYRAGLIREEAVKLAAFEVLIAQYAAENGIKVSDGEKNDMNAWLRGQSAESIRGIMKREGVINLPHFQHVLLMEALRHRVISTIAAEPEKFAPFEQYMEEILGANHILVLFEDFDDEEAALEFAQELKTRTESEDFEELVQTYSQDPGKITFPSGYTFTAGQMVSEFEQATRELEIGEISEPVRSIYGYHIIKRVEPVAEELFGDTSYQDLMIRAVFTGFRKKVENAVIDFIYPTLNNIAVE